VQQAERARRAGRRRSGAILASLAALTLALSATPARADDKATRDAQARFVEGLDRVKAGDFEAARVSFTQAYAVLRKPDILWNLALAEQKSGHLVEALTHFKKVKTSAKTDSDRANADRHITELMGQTAHIDVAAPSGSQLTLDGIGVGLAPLLEPLDVAAGRHHIEVGLAQGATKSADADAVVGQVVHVSFLQAEAVVTPAPGAPPAAAPAAPAPAPAPAPDTATPPPSGHSTFWDARGITVVTVGGLAVVSASLGLAFGIVSNNDASTASNLRQQNPACLGSTSPGCQQLASTTSSQHSAYVTSEGFWIGAGVLAVGAVATWFLWPRPSASASAFQIVPTAGPGGAGALAVGSF
jgi:hypothetical protein